MIRIGSEGRAIIVFATADSLALAQLACALNLYMEAPELTPGGEPFNTGAFIWAPGVRAPQPPAQPAFTKWIWVNSHSVRACNGDTLKPREAGFTEVFVNDSLTAERLLRDFSHRWKDQRKYTTRKTATATGTNLMTAGRLSRPTTVIRPTGTGPAVDPNLKIDDLSHDSHDANEQAEKFEYELPRGWELLSAGVEVLDALADRSTAPTTALRRLRDGTIEAMRRTRSTLMGDACVPELPLDEALDGARVNLRRAYEDLQPPRVRLNDTQREILQRINAVQSTELTSKTFPGILMAIAWRESRATVGLRSRTGDVGVFQFSPGVMTRWGGRADDYVGMARRAEMILLRGVNRLPQCGAQAALCQYGRPDVLREGRVRTYDAVQTPVMRAIGSRLLQLI